VQVSDNFGPFGGNVTVFADVVAQVVELETAVLEELDEFPVAAAHAATRATALVAVVRVVPEDGIAFDIPAFEQRENAYAIAVLFGDWIESGGFE
ncbi:uncharacterized protein METZ01_LOCUS337375, partial [marine metagenome]